MQGKKKLLTVGAAVALCVGVGIAVATQGKSAVDAAPSAKVHADDDHADRGKEGGKKGTEAAVHANANDDDEGAVSLTDAQRAAAGIDIRTAGTARIVEQMELPGEIRFNEDRTGHIVPRVSGIVERVNVVLGQQVRRGDVLAVLSSTQVSEQRAELLTAKERRAAAATTLAREKLLWEEKISAEQDYLQAQQLLREADITLRNARQKLDAVGAGTQGAGGLSRFELRAPFDGTIVAKHAALGEAVTEATNLFTLSDLATVWTEIAVPAQSLGAVRVGTPVLVRATAFDSQAKGSIANVDSLLGEQTRTAKARVVLDNPDRTWRPGVFVNVVIGTREAQVPVAVVADAIQNVEGRTVVFVKTGEGFKATPVETGRKDGESVEIVSGLQADTPYAAANSFVLKAELGKSTAEHGH
ncbi:efflux RND transporter periplasmic adaptor subunit [Pandoraea sp. NPDC090278]|uniref:efflux RND transporter periplasmic adaptor subunit n=1 Tax=Pandoraea sp. NPDC090278 TaxID=3364391 RepID=UPI00383A2248